MSLDRFTPNHLAQSVMIVASASSPNFRTLYQRPLDALGGLWMDNVAGYAGAGGARDATRVRRPRDIALLAHQTDEANFVGLAAMFCVNCK